MQNPFVAAAGGVLSADIAVPDQSRAVEFYSKILTTGGDPLWRNDLMNNLGNPIIGIGDRTPEYDSLPLQWMPHFQVADVASSAARALELGGQELLHGKDDNGESQWACLVDPNNAAFGIIPVVDSELLDSQDRLAQGHISWLSLAAPNASSSRDFYQQVIGWHAQSNPRQETDSECEKFEMQTECGNSVAAVYTLAESPSEILGVWMIYLPVDNLPESLQRVRENGGTVIQEFAESQRTIIRDPLGVFMGLQTNQ